MKKKRPKIKISLLVIENIIFLLGVLCCILALISTYYVDCAITQNITQSIATSVLASVLIPLFLNIGKIVQEKRKLNNLCISIVKSSVFLIGELNNYIAPAGTKPFSNYAELKNRKSILPTLDFENFETFDDLFLLILNKVNCIAKMEFIIRRDLFEFTVQKLNGSTPNATNNKDYVQLFSNLILVLGVVENIKPPICTANYIKRFDDGLHKSYKESEFIYFQTTDDYIIQNIETDLSEKQRGVDDYV